MHSVVIPVFPGVTQLDFTGPHQFLSQTRDIDILVASLGGKDIVTDGLTFSNLATLETIARCDVLLVPGGPGVTDAMCDKQFIERIRKLGATATYITSVCTGSLILGAAGFLRGKRAACHWAWRDLLLPFGAIVDDARVVRDGNIVTGGGVTAGIDFALALIGELNGPDAAREVQLALEYAPSPPFDAGLPHRAPQHVVASYRQRTEALGHARRAQVEQAASDLQ